MNEFSQLLNPTSQHSKGVKDFLLFLGNREFTSTPAVGPKLNYH